MKSESNDDDVYKMSDFNKELKHIRTTRMETGCSCRPLKLDKLSVVKMKAELRNLQVSAEEVEKLSKNDLSAMLKDKLQSCRLCIDNNCLCVQMGIGCSAESCGCLKGGIRMSSAQACGNVNGRRVYNSETVNIHRMQYLPADSKLRERIARRSSF